MLQVVVLALCMSLVAGESAPIRRCMETEIESRLPDDIHSLSGVWYKVGTAHRTLDTSKTAFVMKLEPDGANQLKMTEYYEKEEECKGPVMGEWRRTETGNLDIKINIDVKTRSWEQTVKALYHSKRPGVEKDEVLALYGCTGAIGGDGQCDEGQRVAVVLSRTPRPSTALLLRAFYKLSSEACVRLGKIRTMNADSECAKPLLGGGAESSEEESSDSSSSEGSSSSSSESSEEEACSDNAFKAGDDLRIEEGKYYLIATKASFWKTTGVTGVTFEYGGESEGGKYKIQNNVFIDGKCYTTAGKIPKKSGTDQNMAMGETPLPVKGFKVIHNEGGVLAWIACFTPEETFEGTCKDYVVQIFAQGRSHVRDAQLRKISEKLRDICIDPTDLFFVTSNEECRNPQPLSASQSPRTEYQKCKVSDMRTAPAFRLEALEGVWYTVATETGGKMGELSAFSLRMAPVQDNKIQVQYFKQTIEDRCIENTAVIEMKDAAKAEITFTHAGPPSKTYPLNILYASGNMVLAYKCLKKNKASVCVKATFLLLSRTRDVHHRDVMLARPFMNSVCIEDDRIDWKDTHSKCGKGLDPPFAQRHGYLAMNHQDVMDIVTKYSDRQCNASKIVGQDFDVKKFTDVGIWYGVAYYDPKFAAFPFYGFMAKYKAEGDDIAIGREIFAADLGEGKKCYSARGAMVKKQDRKNPDSTVFRYSWTVDGQSYVGHLKTVWTNYKLSVGYTCREQDTDGSCKPGKAAVYIMSRKEAVDHSEFLLLEQVVRSLCVDPNDLSTLNTHESCFHENLKTHGKEQYQRKSDCNWDLFKGQSFDTAEVSGTYHTVAIAERQNSGLLSRTFKMERAGTDTIKVIAKLNRGGECMSETLEMKKLNDPSNALTYNYNVSGQIVPISVWLAHVFGPFRILVGCMGPDCDETTGFSVIESMTRATDRMALHDVYHWLAHNCIHPSDFRFLDTHNECGAEMDTISCKADDIKGLEEFDESLFNGQWYLVADLSNRYKSMSMKVEAGADENTRKTTSYAEMGGHNSRCHGPSEGTVKYNEERNEFQYQWEKHRLSLKLLYLQRGHMLFYACHNKNPDGSCMRDRTTLMYFSTHRSIERDNLPEDMLAQLRNICVHDSLLQYTQETACGRPTPPSE